MEHETVHNILKDLLKVEEIEQLYLEFDSHNSKEAHCAYCCDKLDCDLKSKLYDEENCVDLNKQDTNDTINNPVVKSLLDNGASWSEMWLQFGQKTEYIKKR